MDDGPFWLAPLEWSATGVDHLGLRAPGLAMADTLLPGITNTTKRVRYYTVIAWMYHHAKTRQHLRLLESAFVQSIRHHEHVTPGGVSAIGSQTLPTEEHRGRVPLLAGSRRLPSVLDPAYYGPSAALLGIAADGDGHLQVTREARDLARTLSVDAGSLPAPTDTAISVSALQHLGPLCFCQEPGADERQLLEEFLFRMQLRRDGADEERVRDGPRRRTLALLLDLVRPGDDEELTVLQRVLDWGVGRDGYSPPAVFEEEAYGLAVLALRRHFRHALESVWSAFGRLIREYSFPGCTVGPYVHVVLAEANGEDEWNPSRDAAIHTILAAADVAPGAELRGSKRILEQLEAVPARAVVTAAVLLAMLAEQVPRFVQSRRYYRSFLDLGEPYWVPIGSFARRLDRSMALRDWVQHLIERYAVAQHQLTGARKAAQDVDGFFFHPTEAGYRLSPATRPPWNPDGGRTKLPAAFSLLEGLSHVTATSTGWQRAERGTEMLESVLADPGARR